MPSTRNIKGEASLGAYDMGTFQIEREVYMSCRTSVDSCIDVYETLKLF